MSKDYSKHIAENIAKGSKMCPFGSMFIKEEKKLPDDFDINGYDPNAPDSDDEPLSDIDLWGFEWYMCQIITLEKDIGDNFLKS